MAQLHISPSQHRMIVDADPDTGRVSGHRRTTEALISRNLAASYGRTGGVYLTEAGRELRARLTQPEKPAVTESGVEEPCGFRYNDGSWNITDACRSPAARAREVVAAWASVLSQRRLLRDGADRLPAPWEHQQPVRAVSIALEAAGVQPAAVDEYGRCARAGYVVVAASSATQARISFRVPHIWEAIGHEARRRPSDIASRHVRAVGEFEQRLEGCGWQATAHRSPYSAHPFVIASPRRK